MPLMTSLLLMRPNRLWIRSPARPHQLVRRASMVVGWLMTAGGPLDGVDLGHQGGVDEPGVLEELVVGEGRVAGLQVVADGVVLEGEQVLEHGQAQPEAGDQGRVEVGVGGVGDQPGWVTCSFPSTPVRTRSA